MSLEDLYRDEKYHSFMRPGRIDHFIELNRDRNKTKLVKHKDIIGYPKDDPVNM
jgi:hypothetical protein